MNRVIWFSILFHISILVCNAQQYKVFFEPESDVLPIFSKGDVNEYIRNNLNIPNSLPKIPANVMIKFTVTKNGKVQECKIKQSSGVKEVDEKILSVIKSMPDWRAGKNNGKNVNIDVYIPIYGGVHYKVDLKRERDIWEKNKSIKVNDTIQKEVWNGKFEPYPQFIGGKKKLTDFLEMHIKYPAIAIESNIGGSVVVQFTVTDLGEIENVRLIRGVDPASDREAMRAIKTMPLWMPAKNEGKKISSEYQIVFFFDIETAKKNYKFKKRIFTNPIEIVK